MSNATTSIRRGDMRKREQNACTEAVPCAGKFKFVQNPMSQGSE
jgi:hypothetical protein